MDDNLVRYVVGVGRDFCNQQAAGSSADFNRRRHDEIEIARKIANALAVIIRAGSIFPIANFSVKLDQMLKLGELRFTKNRLQEFCKNKTTVFDNRASRAGRKTSTDHAIVAIAQLVWIWSKSNHGRRGRAGYLEAALEPLGYDTSRAVFKHHLQKARAISIGR